jgi:cob(I)alamin adenosyltransferase
MTEPSSAHEPGDEQRGADEPPRDDPRPDALRTVKSLVVVNTGDGKGKSSAAFGVMLRALARDWPVAVVQFLKSGAWNTGEEAMGRRLGVTWYAIGDGFTWDSANLSEDEAKARDAWRAARDLIVAGAHRLVILDEITYPMNWGWIDSAEVVETIRTRPAPVSIVATGRDAPAALIDVADTVTEMRSVKHAYERGIAAKKGIDW